MSIIDKALDALVEALQVPLLGGPYTEGQIYSLILVRAFERLETAREEPGAPPGMVVEYIPDDLILQ